MLELLKIYIIQLLISYAAVVRKVFTDNYYIYIFDIEKRRIQSLDNTNEVNLKVKECFKFMEQYTEEVVIFKDNKLEYINFPILPFCRFWDEEIRDHLRVNMDRNSAKSKCDSIPRLAPAIIKTLKLKYRIYTRVSYPILRTVFVSLPLWQNISCLLVIYKLYIYI